jgi:hypothetical protein
MGVPFDLNLDDACGTRKYHVCASRREAYRHAFLKT